MAFYFKRWFQEKYTFNGEEISFELKHLTAFEERELRAHVVRAMGAMDSLKLESEKNPDATAEISAQTLEAINRNISEEFTANVFAKYVRSVSGVIDEAGTPRVDGSILAEIADGAFLWSVLLKLLRNGKVTVEEGKASGSPSTSASVAEPTSSVSASPAQSTGSAASPTPSTATPTIERSPSGAPGTSQAT